MDCSNPTTMWKDRRTRTGTRYVNVECPIVLAEVRWKGTGVGN